MLFYADPEVAGFEKKFYNLFMILSSSEKLAEKS